MPKKKKTIYTKPAGQGVPTFTESNESDVYFDWDATITGVSSFEHEATPEIHLEEADKVAKTF